MSIATPNSLNSGFVTETLKAVKSVYRQDKHARYAMEIAGIGLVLLVGMSMLGGQPGTGSPRPATPTSASYTPASTSPSSAPSLTAQQAQQIAAQSGAKVVTPLVTEPIKVKPVLPESKVSVNKPSSTTSDPFTFYGTRSGPRPVFVKDEKD